MKNADMPAMPCETEYSVTSGMPEGQYRIETEKHAGLTKREIIAMHALPALIECNNRNAVAFGSASSITALAESAVQYADALLKELEK